MTVFSKASTAQQSLLVVAMFAVVIFSFFSIITSYKNKKRALYGFIDTVLFLIMFSALAAVATVFSRIYEENRVDVTFKVPMWLMWCITGAAFGYLIYEAAMRYRRRDEVLGRNCVKQAMDMFPCGVCYFENSGEVKLCNLQMHRLFHLLAQKELQTLDDLTQALGECDAKSGIIRLSDIRQTYLFPDGKVWRYSQNTVTAKGTAYTESVFADVTELYEKNLELHRQTAQLEKISRDIKQLSENVQTLAKEREILVAKSKLHDQMGSGLLAVRQILLQKTTSEKNAAAVMQFRRAVGILREENVSPQYDVTEFIRDAEVSGISVEITGELPKEKPLLRLILPLLREACVNAARHADATALYVATNQTADTVVLNITNDGKQPECEAVPRGGLADYQRRIKDAGGSMIIKSQPTFTLTVTLPIKIKNREE